jgi:hypothetical protein
VFGAPEEARTVATQTTHEQVYVGPAREQPTTPTTKIGSFVPPVRRASAAVIEIVPEGSFFTYGLGVPLRKMFDPAARARVSVKPEDSVR